MKIYTRTGDAGTTGLFGGPRVEKTDARIEAYGTVDELNASLGVVISGSLPDEMGEQLLRVQNELFSIGAELASPDPEKHNLRVIGSQHIGRLEDWIDQHERELPPLKHFVLPGGTTAASNAQLSRAICRRAERRVIQLRHECAEPVSDDLIVYLNRLSDYLFVLSRRINVAAGIEEIIWQGD